MTMRILIAGGGTGGHVFPGIALAEEFMTRHTENDILFVGTERGLEARAVPRAGYPVEFIEVVGLKGKGLWGLLKGMVALPKALFQSVRIVRRYRPGIVVAVGGYASGPVALAAWLMRIPVVVQEQNALPGFTTRTVSRFSRKVFVAFDEARRFFPKKKVMITGNPIRQSLLENFLRPVSTERGPVVLAFGGSQGAVSLNRAVIGAFRALVERFPGIRLIHQTGTATREQVEQDYAEAGFADRVEVLDFIDDMSRAYAEAQVVICRAGATTLAELTVCQRPSILVPFPYAADNHQVFNARALESAGAAVVIEERDLTPDRLAEEVTGLLEDPDRRRAMERAAGRVGHPEAAKEIADVCVDIWTHSGAFDREDSAYPRNR